MYRISAFNNAEEFNEIFGKTTHGNGVVSRKNKILLAFYKSKSVWDFCHERNEWYWLGIKDMQTLKRLVLGIIEAQSYSKRGTQGWHYCNMFGNMMFSSPKYEIDNDGICLDGSSADVGFVRYRNMERGGKVYKMSAGKWFNHIITSTDFGGNVLPQQVVVWLCEQLVEQWRTYVADKCPTYELHIGDEMEDFERIYDDEYYNGEDFGSCMTCEGYHTFYKDAVNSRAAWLEDENENVVARCVIYDDVKDQDGNIWRLAERQYSAGCCDLLKRQLVNALIKAGEIDGFKQVGAGCGDAKAFVDNDGNSLRDKRFVINCYLEDGDTVSYQDSFKWYDRNKKKAYNYGTNNAYLELDTTGGVYNGPEEWDDYHEEYVYETTCVYYEGRDIFCDTDRLDDFVRWNGDYFHKDEMVTCDECGEEFPDPNIYEWANQDAVYSELTGEWYCDCDCKESAEESYKETYWHLSDIDDEYVEDEDDLSSCLIWSHWRNRYIVGTVITANISKHLKEGKLFLHNGVLADNIDKMLQDDVVCEELERMNVELFKTA